ncbi:hypothetical protein F5B22DRAFT_655765 [Xylaria bambusicola]|uniref:uncharacterized protein n=1 Tax=Xylaria bambusicola TaxID=326684 RepID=UPI002007C3C7|nr:uncharacterized protein F5B22DRAFT_655765 [Xylaria bambusicola]KAI0526642.1 hypothetical protein F5B22DRAFT_655765 [Xylaria bambusicola]
MDEQSSLPTSTTGSGTPAPPVPVSTYSTYKPQTFQPTCTHLTMTRVYDTEFNCSLCHALQKNQAVSFDFLGTVFGNEIRPGLRSPERRASKLSFFEEISPGQMKTYSPTQVATILEQRENVLNIVSQQHQASDSTPPLYYPSGSYRRNSLKLPAGLGFPVPTGIKPWVPREDDECQAKYCHYCRPSCEPRSYLSLNGIMSGEVPPTVATGYGFHRMKARPIVDATIIRDIGLRPVPWPRVKAHICPSSPSSQSTWSLSDITEEPILETEYVEPGEGSTIDSFTSTPSEVNIFEQQRPAFTPPSTPICWTGIAQQENGTVNFESCPFVCDGRSPESLKTNYQIHRQVVRSIAGLMEQELDEAEIEEFQSICSFKPTEQSMFLGASLSSVKSRMLSEDFNRGGITPMIKEDIEEGRFHRDPLHVGDGIAVLEESIELGVPDVITKM